MNLCLSCSLLCYSQCEHNKEQRSTVCYDDVIQMDSIIMGYYNVG